MSDRETPVGKIRTEVHGRVFKIVIDNAAKKNAFSPHMMAQMSDALTTLHNNEEYWVGVICAEGHDFTAGLDMPKFFGPKAEKWDLKEGNIDVFGLANRCRKPIVTAVQGIVFTIGIEMMLAGDIVVAADDCRFCQMESKRGIAPLGGAHFRFLTRAGWGDAMYHLLLCDEFNAHRAYKIGLVQEVVAAGHGNRAAHCEKRSDRYSGHQGSRIAIHRKRREGGHRLHSKDQGARFQQRGCQRGHAVVHRAARSGVSRPVKKPNAARREYNRVYTRIKPWAA
jgi:enoyl-CoA hydratase/carnithine racemase